MGKRKYLNDIEQLFEKSPVVDSGSIKRLIRHKKKVRGYHKQLIRNLLKQNKIFRITKGYYSIHDDPALSVFCFNPAYLGLGDALSAHNLWEQETIPVILTQRKVRTGTRKIRGINILIRRILPKYLFGFEYYKDGDFYYPYSDIEKTFIDMVYFRQPMDKEVIREFRKKINKKKLNSYLRRYPKKFRKKVIDTLGIRV